MITAGGTLQFQSDGFENDTVGTNPSVTSAGSWSNRGTAIGSSSGQLSVYGPASVGPGAIEGDNYTMLYKTPNGSYKDIYAFATMAGGPVTSGTVVAEHSVYFPSLPESEATQCRISFVNDTNFGASSRHTRISFDNASAPAGYVGIASYDGAAYVLATINNGASNLVVPVDTWVTLRHTLDFGTKLTITVDGVESDPLALNPAYTSVPVAGLFFGMGDSTAAGRFYIDGVVPEPGTMALLATGLIGLLCYAWRKRK